MYVRQILFMRSKCEHLPMVEDSRRILRAAYIHDLLSLHNADDSASVNNDNDDYCILNDVDSLPDLNELCLGLIHSRDILFEHFDLSELKEDTTIILGSVIVPWDIVQTESLSGIAEQVANNVNCCRIDVGNRVERGRRQV